MGTRMTYLLVMVVLTLLGCSSQQMAYLHDPKQWEQQYATHASFCETRARATTGNALSSDEWYRQVFRECMDKKGWSQVHEGAIR